MHVYIKNPNRDKPKQPEKYVPEYLKHGIDPVPIANPELNSFLTEENKLLPLQNEYDQPEVLASLDDITFDDEDELVAHSNQEIPISTREPEVGQFILLINGQTVLVSSDKQEIENRVKKIAYGEDSDFQFKIELNDIVILKRLGLNVGIFLKE